MMRTTRSRTGALLAAATLALLSGRAFAHGDDRGALQPPGYGGLWKVGAIFWVDPRNAEIRDESGAVTTTLNSNNFYYAVGLSYGIGPNTMISVYEPYDHWRLHVNGQSAVSVRGLSPISVGVQQRIARWDGAGTRTEVAVAGTAMLPSPDDEKWPSPDPVNYLLGVGVNRYALRHMITASVTYTGVGHDALFSQADVTENATYQIRPSQSLSAKGRDLLIGVETTHSSSGGEHRLTAGPIVTAYMTARTSVQASYVLPVWEKKDPGSLGGGQSLWVTFYVVP